MRGDLIARAARGGAAGLVGTLALGAARAVGMRWPPGTLPPYRQDPGKYMVDRAERLLPAGMRAHLPERLEAVAAILLALGYGLAASAIYAALRPQPRDVAFEGTVLGLGTWAVGYLGWLPALGLMPPIHRQRLGEVAGPLVWHEIYGIATVATYRWLRRH